MMYLEVMNPTVIYIMMINKNIFQKTCDGKELSLVYALSQVKWPLPSCKTLLLIFSRRQQNNSCSIFISRKAKAFYIH